MSKVLYEWNVRHFKETNEQLNILIDNLDFDREMELIYNGIRAELDGLFTVLHYKYKDGISNPPKELIK